MWNFLNWYHEDRQKKLNFLKGGMGAAAWPFDWFAQNFDAIAASIVASASLLISNRLIRPMVKKAFASIFSEIKKKFSPFPPEILQLKPQEMDMDEFKKYLTDMGMMDNYLYVFNVEEKYLDEILRRWVKQFSLIIESLSKNEIDLLMTSLDNPVHLPLREAVSHYNSLREKKLIRFIEPEPQKMYAVVFPEEIDIEWPPPLTQTK